MDKQSGAFNRFNSSPENWKSEKKEAVRRPRKKPSKKLFVAIGVLLAVTLLCWGTVTVWEKVNKPDYSSVPNPVVTIEMESGDIIRLELYPQIAPITVSNFVNLVQDGFYDGLIFHRVIANFMIQGGDPEGTGMGGPGFCIKGEFAENGVPNSLSHKRGVLSMARSQSYDSAGSQFFIMHADTPSLDGKYAAFGQVMDEESLKTIDKIAATKTDSGDKPLSEWRIKKATVDTFGYEYKPERIGG